MLPETTQESQTQESETIVEETKKAPKSEKKGFWSRIFNK